MSGSTTEPTDRMDAGTPGTPLRFRLSKGSYFVFLGSVASVVGSVTISVILARFLGSEGLGIYAIYTIIGLVVLPLFAFSIPSAVTRTVAELRETGRTRLREVLSTSLLLMLATTALGTALLFFLGAPVLSDLYRTAEIDVMVRILAVFAFANIASSFVSAVLQGFEDFQTVSLIGSVTTVASVVLLLALVPVFGVIGAAWSAGVVATFNAGLSVVAMRGALHRRRMPWRWSYSRSEARGVLAFSGPLNAASLVARLSSFVQSSLVAIYLGFQDLGLLRIAGVFYSAILFVPRSALSPMFPILSSMAATRTEERSREILTHLIKLAILIPLPVAGGLLLALPFVIPLLYGPEFLGAEPFAALTILIALFALPNAILGEQHLLARGRTRANLLVTSYSAGLTVGLVLLLLPTFGAIALPVSALTAESSLFVLILLWTNVRREIQLRTLLPTLGYLLVTTIAFSLGAPQLPAWARLVAAPLGAALVAFVGYNAILSPEERELLRSMVGGGLARLRGR